MTPDEMRKLAAIEPADHFLANVDGSTNNEWPALVVCALCDAADQIEASIKDRNLARPPEPAGTVTDDDIYEQGWRAGQEAAATELAKLREVLEYALHAIDTGKSEPLFAAQDLIRNTLQGGPDDT